MFPRGWWRRFLESRLGRCIELRTLIKKERCFIAYVQFFNDKKSMILKSTGLIPHMMHIILLNCSYSYMPFLVENRHFLFEWPAVARRRERKA